MTCRFLPAVHICEMTNAKSGQSPISDRSNAKPAFSGIVAVIVIWPIRVTGRQHRTSLHRPFAGAAIGRHWPPLTPGLKQREDATRFSVDNGRPKEYGAERCCRTGRRPPGAMMQRVPESNASIRAMRHRFSRWHRATLSASRPAADGPQERRNSSQQVIA